MLAPAGTKRILIDYMQASTSEVLKIPAVSKRFAAQGLETYGSPAPEFNRYLREEVGRWRRVVKDADIRGE